MTDTYSTIATISEGIYKEKGSKFIAFAHPVGSAEGVKELIKIYKNKYYDARHICYAYMLGYQKNEWRTNDDGEPNGTAGKPILGQINSKELTNVFVVVVRYFGGILLGKGGLITAYKQAAADALNNAEIIQKTIECKIEISFEYHLQNDVMRVVKDSGANIIMQSFDNLCLMQISIRKQNELVFVSELKKILGLTLILI